MMLPSWVNRIDEGVLRFLSSLETDTQQGRYFPCLEGVTEEGKTAALGFSCFALKIFYMLGEWEKLDDKQKNEWISFIQSFQESSNSSGDGSIYSNAFIDPVLINYIQNRKGHFSFRGTINSILTRRFLKKDKFDIVEEVILAETKQSISTLAEIGVNSNKPYGFFPRTEEKIEKLFRDFDWRFPYDSGAQAAIFSVILTLNSERLMENSVAKKLRQFYAKQFASIANVSDGCYYRGKQPSVPQLVNGAMKILSGLKWLNEPIHYPKSLIDTCLAYEPATKGCDLINVVYVLYRCNEEVSYREKDIRRYCFYLLDMIKEHQKPDGGFSYYTKHSQRSYYGLPITRGLVESDMHGTVLLTWALVMIVELIDLNKADWKVIKP